MGGWLGEIRLGLSYFTAVLYRIRFFLASFSSLFLCVFSFALFFLFYIVRFIFHRSFNFASLLFLRVCNQRFYSGLALFCVLQAGNSLVLFYLCYEKGFGKTENV